MRSFAHLDYLCLEINEERHMKYLMADKSTQSDECKHNQIITVQSIYISAPPKQPPKRPPPPRIKSVDDSVLLKSSERTSGIDNFLKFHKDMKIKRKFHTLKERTSTFTKNVYKKMAKRSSKFQSVSEVTPVNGDLPNETKITVSTDEIQNSEKIIPQTTEITFRSKPADQNDKCRSLNHKSAPPKIMKSVSSVISMEDILSENDSIFSKYDIISLINEYLTNKLTDSELLDFDRYVDNCLTAFIRTCHLQVKDTIYDLNERLAHFLDLDSVSLRSNEPEIYTIHCIPGWKQIRIIEDNITKEKYLSLKNSHYQSWIQVNLDKLDLNQRWTCFPIHSINTFENEIKLAEQDNFQRDLLKMIMLICINNIYNDEKFPKNVDPNTILLVSSKCGIIVVFKECLNESELFSLELLGCDSIESIPNVLLESKLNIQKIIENFFQRPEVISILISSTWPLDYLALFLAELVTDNNE